HERSDRLADVVDCDRRGLPADLELGPGDESDAQQHPGHGSKDEPTPRAGAEPRFRPARRDRAVHRPWADARRGHRATRTLLPCFCAAVTVSPSSTAASVLIFFTSGL